MPNEARRWLWIFLLTAASVFVTLGMACATPFAALFEASIPLPVSDWRGMSFTTTFRKPCSSRNSRARPRSRPSTSTFTFPSGSFRLCTMLTMVPTW